MALLLCPLCGFSEVTPLFCTAQIIADFEGDHRPIGGLTAFVCPESHIFFVRTADLEVEAAA